MTYEEQKAHRIHVRDRMPAIAAALSAETRATWTVDALPPDADLDRIPGLTCPADGMRLYVSADWNNKHTGSLSVGTQRVNHCDGSDASYGKQIATVNISTSKTDAQIARDIQRRIIVPYTPIYEQIMQNVRDYAARCEKAKRRAHHLAELIGARVSYWKDGREDHKTPRASYRLDPRTVPFARVGDIEITPERITFDLSVPDPGIAAAILKLMPAKSDAA